MRLIRSLVGIAVITATVAITAVAQQQSDQSSPQNTILKPKMTLGDVLFTINVLNTVEIKGSEVEAFLDVKNVFVQAAQKAQKEKERERRADRRDEHADGEQLLDALPASQYPWISS